MGMGAVVSVAPIEVVLPTYNGVRYLEAQIASIDNQTLRPQRVLLRDDGSSDGTQALIRELEQRYGTWLQVLPADGNLGCTANVNRLLQATTAPYVALADQDDLWKSEKLQQSLDLMKRLEACHGNTHPLLVHSDLELVDDAGKPMGCRYLQRQRLDPQRTEPADLALTNVVTGCTALINRALLGRALPIPRQALMHDWWLALVAASFGRIELLPHPTVLYRQHSFNVLGSQGLGTHYCLTRLKWFLLDPAAAGQMRGLLLQVDFFQHRYAKSISGLPFLMQLRRRHRWLALLKLQAKKRPSKHGPLRTIGLYLLLICRPYEN
jgi:glycosyltransferase involved in cell wall biosynthesis